MNGLFLQGGKGSTGILTNKQAIARHFGVKEDEVVYFTVGIDLSGFKVIYDESTQRAYSLPSGIVSGTTAISLNSAGVLVHSAGNVDLGALAVTREEYVTLPGSFETGVTVNAKNELVVFANGKYRWDGALPKVVDAASSPETSGGIASGAWVGVVSALLTTASGTGLVGHKGANFSDTTAYLYLSWRNGDITAFGGVYDDASAGDLNKAAFATMQDTFGGVRINLMGKAVYLPNSMELEVGSLEIWGGGNIFGGSGYMFRAGDNGFVNIKEFTLQSIDASGNDFTRLVGAPSNRVNLIQYVEAAYFKTIGRVIVFAGNGRAGGDFNPVETSYGCKQINFHHFSCEEPGDYLVSAQNYPFDTFSVTKFYVHNMKGTLINAGIDNDHVYERQLNHAMKTLIVSDYTVMNEDDFWADGVFTYTTVAIAEVEHLVHTNGRQHGVKVKEAGNVVYDIYNNAFSVQEENIFISDCFNWNDGMLMPHKIKGAWSYSSKNKHWVYRKSYVVAMKAIHSGISEGNAKGSFFYPETDDLHTSAASSVTDWTQRQITITDCFIELIKVNQANLSRPLFNVRLDGNTFVTHDSGTTHLVQFSAYPHNLYQQMTVTNNRIIAPALTLSALVGFSAGSQAGGGVFQGVVDISNNTVRAAAANLLADWSGGQNIGTGSVIRIDNNDMVTTGNCQICNSNPSYVDSVFARNNYLQGTATVGMGKLNASAYAYETVNGFKGNSPIVLFQQGIPTAQQINSRSYRLEISGTNGEKVTQGFTITAGVSTTSIRFVSSDGNTYTKVTGTDNGTFEMQSTSSDGLNLEVVVASDGVTVRTASSVMQRFEARLYAL